MAADDLISFGTLKVLCPNLGKFPIMDTLF